MATRKHGKTASAATIRTRNHGKPESMIATLSTLDTIIAFALAHVTSANIDAMIRLVRDTFGRNVINRNVGRTTGWRIMDFQNRLLERVTGMSTRPTLVQLVFIGTAEFPGAVGRIFAPVIPGTNTMNVSAAVSQWNGVVTLYNTGKHANPVPVKPCPTLEPGITIVRRPRVTVPAPVAPVAPVPVKTDRKTGARLVRKSA